MLLNEHKQGKLKENFFWKLRVFLVDPFCIHWQIHQFFAASAVASWMKMKKCNFAWFQKIFRFCSFQSLHFIFFLLPRINRKLLAVLQKFKNNTQSETSSMAFTNFHSCLKNSFFSFFWVFSWNFFARCFHARCLPDAWWKTENEKRRNYE